MKTETVNTDEKPLRSMPWVGEAPPMTPEADGWWWVWVDGQWCAATLRFEPESVIRDATIRITFLRGTGGMSGDTMRAADVSGEVWGGRIAVPGDSPNAKISGKEPRQDA